MGSVVRRQVPFFLYLAIIVALAGSIAYFGWVRTWSSVFVPAMYPAFADMRLVQGSVISVDSGLDPHVSNPFERWGRLFDYPMPWIAIGKALNFADESRFILICTALVLSFAGVCAFLIFRFPSFGLLASLVSTATLFGIERANTDLVIFCLLFPALWFPRSWSPISILLGTALKLYPVFALGALVMQRQFRLFAASLAVAVAIFVYLWDELAAIQLNIPVNCWISYGFPSVRSCLAAFAAPWQVVGTFAMISIATLALAYCFSRSNAVTPQHGAAFNLLLVGASIYVGTFLVSSNYDYRLIFLILCIPFLQTRPFPFARVVIVVILIAMNELLLWRHVVPLFIFSRLAKIAIFIVFGAYLMSLAWAAVASLHAKPKPVMAGAGSGAP